MAASKSITGASGAAIGRAIASLRPQWELSLHTVETRSGCGEYGAPEIVGVAYLHRDGAIERRRFSVKDRVKIVQVLLSANKAARSRFTCSLQYFLLVAIGVVVMIREKFVAGDI